MASRMHGAVSHVEKARGLPAYRRQNQVDLALQELRRLERTLFRLDRLESPELRRCCISFLMGATCRAGPYGLPARATMQGDNFIWRWGVSVGLIAAIQVLCSVPPRGRWRPINPTFPHRLRPSRSARHHLASSVPGTQIEASWMTDTGAKPRAPGRAERLLPGSADGAIFDDVGPPRPFAGSQMTGRNGWICSGPPLRLDAPKSYIRFRERGVSILYEQRAWGACTLRWLLDEGARLELIKANECGSDDNAREVVDRFPDAPREAEALESLNLQTAPPGPEVLRRRPPRVTV